MTVERRALVVSFTQLNIDPRICRQIDWLSEDGWAVDTLGLGPHPDERVRTHFALSDEPISVGPRFVKGAIHTVLPYYARFRLIVESRIPQTLRRARRAYELVIINDIDLLPWAVRAIPGLVSTEPGAIAHLDLHEYHSWTGGNGAVTDRLLAGYHRWMTSLLASPVFTSRSTVASGIARLYATEFGIPEPSIVRNSPAFVDQRPRPVDPARIELVYHGNAELARGLSLLVEAFAMLNDRFHLTLMLTGLQSGKDELRRLTANLGDRVTFREPVPMADVARALNGYDLEVIFYPPTSPNFLYSLPNKFFEAVQGRIGVVAGESPSMVEIIEAMGNGVIVTSGWSAADLAAGISALSPESITRMKQGAAEAAASLNADREREAFLAGIGDH